MFITLGILLSTIFTPILPSFNTTATTYGSFRTREYQILIQQPDNYQTIEIPQIQEFNYGCNNLDTYLIDYAQQVDTSHTLVGYHDCNLFSISYTSPDGLVFNNYIKLAVNYRIYEIHPSQGVTIYRTTDYIFGLNFNDYDYPEVPTFNFTMYYYWSDNSDYLYNTNHQYHFGNRDYIDMVNREIDDTSEAIDYSINYIIPFYFHCDFFWFTEDIYNNALLGMYPVDSSYEDGYKLGYKNGKEAGLLEGAEGFISSSTYAHILEEQYEQGKQAGISIGREEVLEQGQTATVIFNGIISVALLPVNVFLRMLNLEVFGINLGALVSSLLTICVIIIVARMIFGKSGE